VCMCMRVCACVRACVCVCVVMTVVILEGGGVLTAVSMMIAVL
jgi:hypothetical protein